MSMLTVDNHKDTFSITYRAVILISLSITVFDTMKKIKAFYYPMYIGSIVLFLLFLSAILMTFNPLSLPSLVTSKSYSMKECTNLTSFLLIFSRSSCVNWTMISGLFTHCIQPNRLLCKAPNMKRIDLTNSNRSFPSTSSKLLIRSKSLSRLRIYLSLKEGTLLCSHLSREGSLISLYPLGYV